RSSRPVDCTDYLAAQLEISAGGFYTFSGVRHREAAAAAPSGTYPGGSRHHARRCWRRLVCPGGGTASDSSWLAALKIAAVYRGWVFPTGFWARKTSMASRGL